MANRVFLSMRHLLPYLSLLVLIGAAKPALAYLTFGDQFFGGMYLKWGDPAFGTGATVTWGFMADGTGVDPNFRIDPFSYPNDSGVEGTSNISQIRNSIDSQKGAGTFVSIIQNSLATWSAAANVNFVFVPNDSGLPVNDPGATSPQIRIGAFMPNPNHSFANVAAVGFAPPPNGGTLEGDILFNLAAGFQVSSGTEDVTPIDFSHGNDLQSLFTHELGHALGMAHPDPNDRLTLHDDVMLIHNFGDPYLINRQLSPDDAAGVRHIYGLRNPLQGDLNVDGVINQADLTVLFKALTDQADYQFDYGISNTDLIAVADLDGDHKLTNADIQPLLHYLETGSFQAAVVPEPASAILLVLGLSMVLGNAMKLHSSNAKPARDRGR